MFQPFLIAVRFLTRIPLPVETLPREGDAGRSLLFYPLVGLLIGASLVLIAVVSQEVNVFLSAVLIVSFWVFISGGLHLDGLSDTVDAWVGGMGSKERTLEIMKDPAAGPMGVLSLIILILLKTAGTYTLLLNCPIYYLLISPVIGRSMAILLLATTPYVRENGMATRLTQELNKNQIAISCLVVAALLVICTSLWSIFIIFACVCLLLFWRQLLMKRLEGCTGDNVGALLEVSELVSLILIVLLLT